MSDIFISYARATQARARQIGEGLRCLGHEVWRDDQIPAHRAYADVISERLRAAKAVVVVWSAEAARSEWVRSEAERARAQRKLVQLTIDGAELPMPFDQIECADLSDWTAGADTPGWRKVIGSLAELTGASAAAPPSAAAQQTGPGLSLCVLPFANMSDDPQQDYFSNGVTEDIITDLSKIGALKVTSRNTAFSFKDKSLDAGEVARRLSVGHILQGSVRKAGGQVRITAQLIEGASGAHVWAERWDRELGDIFTLQDEIAQAVVAALKLKLLPQEKKVLGARGTDDAEAYNLYLMARQYWSVGNTGDKRRDETVIRLCQRAIERDPNYAQAWALMALFQSMLRFSHGGSGDDGLAAAERAIALDPDLADPHAVRAQILTRQGRDEEALEQLDRALRLDPQSTVVNNVAGDIFIRKGQLQDAHRYFTNVTALDETDFGAAGVLASLRRELGDAEGSLAASRMTLSRVEAAIARDPGNGNAMAFGVLALAALGEAGRAREWMERALLIDPDNLLMRYNFACAWSRHLHDPEAALAMLDQVLAHCQNAATVAAAKTDPDLEPVRGDRRFHSMIARAEVRLRASGARP